MQYILRGVIVGQGTVASRHGRLRQHGHAPQQGVGACIKLRQAERLGQVIIGPPGKPADAVLLVAQRRHQHHRHRLLQAQGFEQAQAIHAGQQDVQQHQIK